MTGCPFSKPAAERMRFHRVGVEMREETVRNRALPNVDLLFAWCREMLEAVPEFMADGGELRLTDEMWEVFDRSAKKAIDDLIAMESRDLVYDYGDGRDDHDDNDWLPLQYLVLRRMYLGHPATSLEKQP